MFPAPVVAPHANQRKDDLNSWMENLWAKGSMPAACVCYAGTGAGDQKAMQDRNRGVAGGLRCFFPAFAYRLQQWHSTSHTSCFPGICGQKRSMHACAWPAQRCGGGLQRLSMLANVSCWSLCGACSGGIICRTRSWSAVHKTRAGLQAARMLQRRLRINVKTWKCSHVDKVRACR